jgi:cyclically-permuted mutarotase family protein
MPRNIKYILLACFIHLLQSPSFGNVVFEWSVLPPLPPLEGMSRQAGLAVPFAGIHNDVLLVAGGSNFSVKPLAEGGEKQYHNNIYVLHNIGKPDAYWEVSAIKFPYRAAHGVSIATTKGIICIGGKNSNQYLSNVTLMSWEPGAKKISFTELPDLPYTNSDMSGALIGNRIYIAGGFIDEKPGTSIVCLDLDNEKTGWVQLPDIPGMARLQPVVAAQNAGDETCLFLFGGYCFDAEKDTSPVILNDAYRYSPSQNKWGKLSDYTLSYPPDEDRNGTLAGASAIPIGSGHILLSGGVDEDIFFYDLDIVRQINNAKYQQDNELISKLTADRIHYWLQPLPAFCFNPYLRAYHTITDTWIEAAKVPWQPAVGSAMIKSGDGFILVNGEIKPGVRTNEVYSTDIITKSSFGIMNCLVLLLYLLGMLLLGFYFMKRTKGTADFFQGGQRIPWWAAGISIFATALSAITFLSIPAKAYATDWRMFIFNIAIILVVPVVIRYYLPFFRKLNVASAYQYLENRFNKPVRFFASGLFCFFMMTRIAIVLFLPSIALNAVTGLNVYFCILVMGLITIAYCTMGGVEAVIWGDVIQGFVLVLGALVALVYMIAGTEGGLGGFIATASDAGKFHTLDFSFNWTQPVFWVVILGGIANQLITYTSDQSVIQRYMTTKDEKSASRSIWLNGILSIPVSIIFFLIGTGLYTFYKSHPQNLNITMQNQDAIFPHFMVTELPAGLAGLLIAAVFSAAMSTLSSNINSVSTAVTEDFFQQIRKNLTEKSRMRIARISGILVGLAGTAFALGLATWDIKSLWDQFNVFLGLLTGGLGGLFLMGIFTRRINGTAAMIGLFSSIVLLLVIRSYTQISFLLFGFIGLVASFVIGWLCSFLLKIKNK